MAQAKKPAKPKTEPKAKAVEPKAAAPKAKTPARKPPTTAASPQIAPPSAPMIDPSHSTAAAAAMVANKADAGPASTGPKQETAFFRNLKQSINKPHSQIVGGILDKLGSAGQKKSSVPFTTKQTGHNQMIGSDATRRNVPRRTGG